MKTIYQARAVGIAYALKHGYDTEYMVYVLMWFVASFGFIAILSWITKKLAGRKEDDK